MIQEIENRRSIRKYKADKINKELIEDIIYSATLAPSAKNRQPWKFIVYNLNGYYDGLKAMLKHMIDMGLSSEERQKGIYFAERLEQITDILCSLKED